jgi:predicted transglutaminase-like cysteine proteinase
MQRRLLGAALAVACCLCATSALAGDAIHGPAHRPFVIGAKTTVPVGAKNFCLTWPAECTPVDEPQAPFVLTEARWRDLNDVNASWNRDVKPVTDLDLYKVSELWTYPDGAGDCEDYALAKRRTLVERGWPSSALLIALVRQKNGDAHAVLVAVTSEGDLVLDNLVANIVDWDQTDYKFVKIQSASSMSQWLKVEDDRQLWADAPTDPAHNLSAALATP